MPVEHADIAELSAIAPVSNSAWRRAQERWHDSAMAQSEIEAFEVFQRGKALAETTIRNRRSILASLQRALDVSIIQATTADLRGFVGRPGIKPGSRRTNRNALVAFYTFLHEDGYRDDNPSLRLPTVAVPKGTPRPFTPEQVDAMLESGAYTRTRAMILLGCYQGFRVSQIAPVHGHDIDRLSNTIRTIGKGGKERLLPLHPVIAELSESMPADGWWFPARHGQAGHIKGSGVTNLIARAKKRAGIHDPRLTAHSLRHAFGTDLVENDVDIRVVQELMMHESLSTTQIYTGVSERKKQAGILALPVRDIPSRSGRRTVEVAA